MSSTDDLNNLTVTATARAIAAHLGLALDGPDGTVASFSPFPVRRPGAICFVQGDVPSGASAAPGFALAVALPASAALLRRLGYSVIASASPKFDLARAIEGLQLAGRPAPGVHATAIVSPQAVVGAGAAIGPYAVIDGAIQIGEGVVIGSHVRLLANVRVGAGTVVQTGTVIGADAFTVGMNTAGRTMRLPSFGGVVIGDGVDIGHNVTIVRAIDGNTEIGSRARISDLAMVGNAVRIGDDAVIMPSVNLGGRTVVGARCWVGMGASIRESVTLGEGSKVGMGAVVLADVAPGEVVAGVPARPIKGRG
jgi:UDP-3-O-[3-hydroxymyristoyl] glucosamine N-acyltransferase